MFLVKTLKPQNFHVEKFWQKSLTFSIRMSDSNGRVLAEQDYKSRAVDLCANPESIIQANQVLALLVASSS